MWTTRGVRLVNKNDLVAAVSDATSFSKADAARAVESVFDTIKATLTNILAR